MDFSSSSTSSLTMDVGAVAAFNRDAVIFRRQIDLTGIGQAVLFQFVAKAAFAGVFQHAGTEASVYPHRQANDLVGEGGLVCQGHTGRIDGPG